MKIAKEIPQAPIGVEQVYNEIRQLVTQSKTVVKLSSSRPKVTISPNDPFTEHDKEKLDFIYLHARPALIDMMDDPAVSGFCVMKKLKVRKTGDNCALIYKNVEFIIPN